MCKAAKIAMITTNTVLYGGFKTTAWLDKVGYNGRFDIPSYTNMKMKEGKLLD